MATVGTASAKIIIQPETRTLACSGIAHLNELVTVSLYGYGAVLPANISVKVYRGTTLLNTQATWTQGSGLTYSTGTLDLSGTAWTGAFDGIPTGSVLDVDVEVWDSSTGELLGIGPMQVRGQDETYA